MPESRRKGAKDLFRGDRPLVGILYVFSCSLNDSLDTDERVFRMDGVDDEDAEVLRICFILAFWM